MKATRDDQFPGCRKLPDTFKRTTWLLTATACAIIAALFAMVL
jgi:hypothetical protein